MRIAIVSDIHGNRTAFDAVLKDLHETGPDLILHGGDLADGGSSPVEIIDHIRALGWQGAMGNTDDMLVRPQSFQDFARQLPHLDGLFAVIEQMADATREMLGNTRLAWLGTLPAQQVCGQTVFVHAKPGDSWTAPLATATEDEYRKIYGSLNRPLIAYGHIHQPFVREFPGMTIVNTGSVGLPYDGDTRASYLVVDSEVPQIRRVEYDLDKEIRALSQSRLPHRDWVKKTLAQARFQMP